MFPKTKTTGHWAALLPVSSLTRKVPKQEQTRLSHSKKPSQANIFGSDWPKQEVPMLLWTKFLFIRRKVSVSSKKHRLSKKSRMQLPFPKRQKQIKLLMSHKLKFPRLKKQNLLLPLPKKHHPKLLQSKNPLPKLLRRKASLYLWWLASQQLYSLLQSSLSLPF